MPYDIVKPPSNGWLDAPYRLPARLDHSLGPRESAVLISGLATRPPAGVGGRLGPFLAA